VSERDEETFCIGDGSDGSDCDETNKDRPLDIHPGTTTIIRASISEDVIKGTIERDTDEVSFQMIDDAVVRLVTYPDDDKDVDCSKIDINFEQSDVFKPIKLVTLVGKDVYEAGVGRCASTTHYLSKGRTYTLKLSSGIRDSTAAGKYLVEMRSLPVKPESDFGDKTEPIISNAHFSVGTKEVSVAVRGLVSANKRDVYLVDVPEKSIRVEVIEGLLTPEFDCESNDYDFRIDLYKPDVAASKPKLVSFDYESGRGECPTYDGFKFGESSKQQDASYVSGPVSFEIVPEAAGNSVTPYIAVISVR
jgi:hypothetical protein